MTAQFDSTVTVESGPVTIDRTNGHGANNTTTSIQQSGRYRAPLDTAIIDTDIHIYFPTQDVLRNYLDERWQDYHRTFGSRGFDGSHFPRAMPNAARHDSWPDDGTPPGSNLPLLQKQLLDEWNIEIGVLNPLVGAGEQRNLAFGAAFARATNEWQLAEWLDPDPRLRASIIVPWEDGELSAAEIDMWGSHPGFVHALLIARTKEPLGRRKYWPMYEAASRHDVPVAIHFGGAGGVPITGSGYPKPLHRRPRRHATDLPGTGDQPDLRRRLQPIPHTQIRTHRRRIRLDSLRSSGGWTVHGANWAARCRTSLNRRRNSSVDTSG